MINYDAELKTLEQEFFEHLQEDNKVTILTAPYGRGKTWFVNHFFNESKSGEKFNLVHLFPVNYSTASSKDIFGLLKYDILLELLKIKPDLINEKKDFSPSDKFKKFKGILFDNWQGLAINILKESSKVGKAIPEEALHELCEMFANADGESLKSFKAKYNQSPDSMYENNMVTRLINTGLEELKSSDPSKRNVLVIDDLDRIDPDHIFRLLNVFSANIEANQSYASGKFSFDHVVIVCDIKNLKDLFKLRYGNDNSWRGFIDKFYSKAPFELRNKSVLKYFFFTLKNALSHEISNAASWLHEDHLVNGLYSDFIEFCIDNDLITFRDVKHLENLHISDGFTEGPPRLGLNGTDELSDYCASPLALLWIGLIIKTFGGREEAIAFLTNTEKIDKLKLFKPNNRKFYLEHILPLFIPSPGHLEKTAWSSSAFMYAIFQDKGNPNLNGRILSEDLLKVIESIDPDVNLENGLFKYQKKTSEDLVPA